LIYFYEQSGLSQFFQPFRRLVWNWARRVDGRCFNTNSLFIYFSDKPLYFYFIVKFLIHFCIFELKWDFYWKPLRTAGLGLRRARPRPRAPYVDEPQKIYTFYLFLRKFTFFTLKIYTFGTFSKKFTFFTLKIWIFISIIGPQNIESPRAPVSLGRLSEQNSPKNDNQDTDSNSIFVFRS
jgi:hypothetical protein